MFLLAFLSVGDHIIGVADVGVRCYLEWWPRLFLTDSSVVSVVRLFALLRCHSAFSEEILQYKLSGRVLRCLLLHWRGKSAFAYLDLIKIYKDRTFWGSGDEVLWNLGLRSLLYGGLKNQKF